MPEERQALDLLGTAAALRAIRGPSPARAAYKQAVQDHEREVERLKAECGVTAADELEDATGGAMNQGGSIGGDARKNTGGADLQGPLRGYPHARI